MSLGKECAGLRHAEETGEEDGRGRGCGMEAYEQKGTDDR